MSPLVYLLLALTFTSTLTAQNVTDAPMDEASFNTTDAPAVPPMDKDTVSPAVLNATTEAPANVDDSKVEDEAAVTADSKTVEPVSVEESSSKAPADATTTIPKLNLGVPVANNAAKDALVAVATTEAAEMTTEDSTITAASIVPIDVESTTNGADAEAAPAQSDTEAQANANSGSSSFGFALVAAVAVIGAF